MVDRQETATSRWDICRAVWGTFKKRPVRTILALLAMAVARAAMSGFKSYAGGFTCRVCRREFVGGRASQTVCPDCRTAVRGESTNRPVDVGEDNE